MQIRIGVFATIVDAAGRALLCHRRDHDFWGQPGGGLEPGETPWEGVVREVREETGLDVEVTRLAGVYSQPASDNLVFSFRCEATAGALTLNDEADDLGYFALDTLPANLFAEHAQRIRDACGAAEAALLRSPVGPTATEEIRLRAGKR
ncbi:MAG: NUDIX hydrolase [Ktedonobacterales bacterium]